MNWQTVLTSFLTSGVTVFIFQYLAKNGISHYYNKKLEKFKEEINIHSEKRSFNFQRKIYDFELYTTKRHSIYAEVFSTLNSCKLSSLLILEKIKLNKSFIKDKESLEKYLKVYLDDENEINSMLNTYKNDEQDQSLIEISSYFFGQLMKNHIKKVEAMNTLVDNNALYMSDTVIEKIREIRSLIIYHAMVFSAERDSSILSETEKEIDELLTNLNGLMKKEIAIGDYNN